MGVARNARARPAKRSAKTAVARNAGRSLAPAEVPFSDRTTRSASPGSDERFKLVAVPGSENTSQAFRDKVVQIAARLETNPIFLMAVMSFESGATFSPSVPNKAGSGAVGLIQFMPATARDLARRQKNWCG